MRVPNSGAVPLRRRLLMGFDRARSPLVTPAETVVVSGFWGSGTSWVHPAIAEALGARRVHEPLHRQVPAARALHDGAGIGAYSESMRELYMPHCGELHLTEPLRDFYDAALRGAIHGARSSEFALRERLRLPVVVKFVRAHLCLRAVQNTFAIPLIHVYRDPRGIVASIRLTAWSDHFEELSLEQQLLERRDGREKYFERWREEIVELDAGDAVDRVSAYWALTERFLADSLRESATRFVEIGYERLCRRRESLLCEAFEALGLAVPDDGFDGALDPDSPTTSAGRWEASVEERIFGWKRMVDASECLRVEEIARRFGWSDRLYDGP